MQEIKVIERQEETEDIRDVSENELDIIFENIQAETGLPLYHITGFKEMMLSRIRRENLLLKPKIDELIVRRIVLMSIIRKWTDPPLSGANFILPIIAKEVVKPSLIQRRVFRFKGKGERPGQYSKRLGIGSSGTSQESSQGTNGQVTGGISSVKAYANLPGAKKLQNLLNKVSVLESQPIIYRVRFDAPIDCLLFYEGKLIKYKAPVGEEINIIGLSVAPICSDMDEGAIHDYNNRLIAGSIPIDLIADTCSDIVDIPREKLVILKEEITKKKRIYFKDFVDLVPGIINNLFDYLKQWKINSYSADVVAYIYKQLELAYSGKAIENKKLVHYVKSVSSVNIPLARPVFTKDEFLLQLQKLMNFVFKEDGVESAIETLGLSNLYYKAKYLGKDSAQVKKIIADIESQNRRIIFQREVNKKYISNNNKLSVYKMIIEQKLGAEFLEKLEAKIRSEPYLVKKADDILNLLDKHRKMVEIEYDRREKFIKGMLENKCPHIKSLRNFRGATTVTKQKQAFDALTEYFSKEPVKFSMIKCKLCNYDIMCPHVKLQFELEMQNKSYNDVKNALMPFIDETPIKGNYYCKVCGENISSVDAFPDVSQEQNHGTFADELKNLMWGEISFMMQWVKVPSLVAPAKLVSIVRDAIYPFIFEIEKQLLKAKTTTAEEIKSKEKLFITIYTLAYIIHLIQSAERKKVSEKLEDMKIIKFRNMQVKNPTLVDYIKYAVNFILNAKHTLITNIPGITGEFIKNKLAEAYKIVAMKNGFLTLGTAEPEHDLLIMVALDPIYHYIYDILSIENGRGKSRYDHVEKIQKYIGDLKVKKTKGAKGATESKDIYQNIHLPDFSRWGMDKFDSVKPIGDVYDQLTWKRVYSVLADAQKGYLARSFIDFFNRIKSRIYLKYIFMDTGDDNLELETGSSLRPEFVKMRDDFMKLLNKQAILRSYSALASLKNIRSPKLVNERQYKYSEPSFVLRYGFDGHKHEWKIWILKDGAEVTKSDISKMIESSKSPEKFIYKAIMPSDYKCSVCKEKMSGLDDSSENNAKLRKTLEARSMLINFYKFYEMRCLESGIHEFVDDVCAKCKLSKADAKNLNIGFFSKHKKQYIKEKSGENISEFIEVEDVEGKKKIQDEFTALEAKYSKYAYNFNKVLEFANIVNLNPQQIVTLGASENVEYSDLLSGTYIPPEPKSKDDSRIFFLKSLVHQLIIEYNRIRFYARLGKPPEYIVTLIESSGTPKHQLADLQKILPSISEGVEQSINYFIYNKKPRETVNFIIELLCEKLIFINNISEKSTKKLRELFVSFFIHKVVNNDTMLSKPGYINWAAIIKDKEYKETNVDLTNDSNFQDEDAGEEEDIEDTEDRPEGSTNEVFKGFSDLDIDKDEDEPDRAGEDEEQQIRVEGYELD